MTRLTPVVPVSRPPSPNASSGFGSDVTPPPSSWTTHDVPTIALSGMRPTLTGGRPGGGSGRSETSQRARRQGDRARTRGMPLDESEDGTHEELMAAGAPLPSSSNRRRGHVAEARTLVKTSALQWIWCGQGFSGRSNTCTIKGMEQSRSTQQIEQDWDHVASLAADLHDAHARLVDFVVAVLADGSWQAAGLRSPEHWLMLRAGLSRGQAGAMVLLARRAGELPATVAALREGRISLDQAAVVARHTPAAFDTTVAEFARHATVTQLQRTVTRYDFTLQPDSVDDRGRGLPGEILPGEMPPGDESGDESGGEGDCGDGGYRKRVPVEPAHLSMGLDADG